MVTNRLEAAKELPENQDPIKQFAIRQAGELLVAADVKDPGMPVAVLAKEQAVGAFVETKPLTQEFRPFTDKEMKALVEDGAVFFDLDGDTIEQEQKEGRPFRYVANGGVRLLKVPSIKTQVAIYPNPKKFFIPDSGNKDLSTQERLAEKDGQELRKRLGLKDDSLTVIIPDQASTLTELTFKYLDETTKKGIGVWLFGPDYKYLYGRTKNPVNESGSSVVIVGDASPGSGVNVYFWLRDDGCDNLYVVRLVVAKKK